MAAAVHEGLVEHAALDKAFRALIDALDQPQAGTLFESLADGIRHHLGSEDLDIAKFADVDPAEAMALLGEHDAIRDALHGLGEQMRAAGTLSPKDVHDLKLRFTMHEAREETGLYRWAATR